MADKTLPSAYKETPDWGTGLSLSYFNVDAIAKKISLGFYMEVGGVKRTVDVAVGPPGTDGTITKLDGTVQTVVGYNWSHPDVVALRNMMPKLLAAVDNHTASWKTGTS